MHVSPTDIRYQVVGVRLHNGIPTPSILNSGHMTRQEAEAHVPIDGRYAHLAHVVGYISNHRKVES